VGHSKDFKAEADELTLAIAGATTTSIKIQVAQQALQKADKAGFERGLYDPGYSEGRAEMGAECLALAEEVNREKCLLTGHTIITALKALIDKEASDA